MNFTLRLILFLVINFGALYVGNVLQGDGPFSEWYQGLNIAPWTPPGWVFGATWTIIMICFSVYLAKMPEEIPWKRVAPIFLVQLVLNVAWNPVFFRYQMVFPALVVIVLLALVVFVLTIRYAKTMEGWTFLMAPYILWLLIAISLNAYVLLNN